MKKHENKTELAHAFAPVLRFLGHSLATAVGFCGLAIISLIPLAMVKALAVLGLVQMAAKMHGLEELLFQMDVFLSSVVFLSAAAVFAVEIVTGAYFRIVKALKKE